MMLPGLVRSRRARIVLAERGLCDEANRGSIGVTRVRQPAFTPNGGTVLPLVCVQAETMTTRPEAGCEPAASRPV
jgi:hypothetical protein